MAERPLSSYELRYDAGEPSELFLDWAAMGVDKAGKPNHVPIVEGAAIICRCHGDGCQLDRALFRARVAGFIQALQLGADDDPLEVLRSEVIGRTGPDPTG